MFSQEIKNKALEIGFSACGITSAQYLSLERETIYRNWLQKGFHADMFFLEHNLEKRMNPQILFEGTKSIIVVLLNYHNPSYHKNRKSGYSFSEYALGIDYHIVLKNKLFELSDFIIKHYPHSKNRIFTDTAPVLEKYLASRAGLGSIGKNTLLLTDKGSYYFIGEIYTDLCLPYDSPFAKDYCMQCERCVNACPTKALHSPYNLNAAKCIAYQSIENKNEIPKDIRTKMGKQVYGCDICQQVCPCNAAAEPTNVKEFSIKEEFLKWNDSNWQEMNSDIFNKSFSNSVLHRVGYDRLMRNMGVSS